MEYLNYLGILIVIGICCCIYISNKNKDVNCKPLTNNVIPDREKAMKWWWNLPDNLCDNSKYQLSYKYFNRHWMSLTGSEIERIWRLDFLPKSTT